jgi:peptidyl-tRNA hydrolase, PTH1 family
VKLICGLGNPGREHERHRHNVGFMVAEQVAARARADLSQEKFDARIGQGALGGERLLFVLPQTYMNLSGTAVGSAARFYKVAVEDVLVVHDELDLPFGRLQLKNGGGAGGHNGLKSILEHYGQDGFARLRFGIGKPEGPNAKERVSGYVLSGFSKAEEAELPPLLDRAAEMAVAWAQDGLLAAMNRYNRK